MPVTPSRPFSRTSNRGVWNLSLLAGAGTSFGAVSCFALHFIGNQSLTLLRPATATEPERHLTLAYDPGFTVLSLVVSVARCVRPLLLLPPVAQARLTDKRVPTRGPPLSA